MVHITFSLIRRHHPELNADNLDQYLTLRLSGLDIEEIDNLEIFSHIKELNLSNNKIERIENVGFMAKLELLDLSNNIISAEFLLKEDIDLPASLKYLNLAGNPCAQDVDALSALQDAYPELNIILGDDDAAGEGDGEEGKEGEGVGGGEEGEEEDDGEEEEEEEERGDVSSGSALSPEPASWTTEDYLKYKPLDSEAVLKQIVERKCQSQPGAEPFDMRACLQVLLLKLSL